MSSKIVRLLLEFQSWAGRSAEDRLLGMEEARGSNPRQSITTGSGLGGFEPSNSIKKPDFTLVAFSIVTS